MHRLSFNSAEQFGQKRSGCPELSLRVSVPLPLRFAYPSAPSACPATCAHPRNITSVCASAQVENGLPLPVPRRAKFFLSLFKNLHPSTDPFALECLCIEERYPFWPWTPLLAFPQEVVDVSALFQFPGGLSSVLGRSVHDPQPGSGFRHLFQHRRTTTRLQLSSRRTAYSWRRTTIPPMAPRP